MTPLALPHVRVARRAPLPCLCLLPFRSSQQGNCVGFRSGAAGNRFIQPQRKAPHRLVFFNQNCGVWEHWTPVGDDWRAAPWSILNIKLQSRRLQNVRGGSRCDPVN